MSHTVERDTAEASIAAGDEGRSDHSVWVLVIADLVLFGSFFITYAHYRHREFAQFVSDQQELNRGLGLVNTLVLITSSLFAAIAVKRVRAGVDATRWIQGAIGCGALFIVIKVTEYGLKAREGFAMDSSTFFQLYYGFTGIHLAHVMCGVAVLLIARLADKRVTAGRPRRGDIATVEQSAVFWHLVDLLWLILFPLFYLS